MSVFQEFEGTRSAFSLTFLIQEDSYQGCVFGRQQEVNRPG